MAGLFELDMERGATFSACGRYRYDLTRTWDGDGQLVAFVMLNPSTADALVDDPTVRRCIGFARRWGYGRLVVLNLFALRSTDPRALYRADDPVGPENDRTILAWSKRATLVVAAWGCHGKLNDRGTKVADMLSLHGLGLHCLKVTADGYPSHPLYLGNESEPIPYARKAAS